MATEAVLQTLQAIWQILTKANVQAALVGGLALANWKHPRTTFDVGAKIQVLSCEDLILFKLLAGRLIDFADAAALIRANGSTINDGVLDQLAEQLGVVGELDRVRRDAHR